MLCSGAVVRILARTNYCHNIFTMGSRSTSFVAAIACYWAIISLYVIHYSSGQRGFYRKYRNLFFDVLRAVKVSTRNNQLYINVLNSWFLFYFKFSCFDTFQDLFSIPLPM